MHEDVSRLFYQEQRSDGCKQFSFAKKQPIVPTFQLLLNKMNDDLKYRLTGQHSGGRFTFCGWRFVVDGFRLAVGVGWRLAVGVGWRLAVGVG